MEFTMRIIKEIKNPKIDWKDGFKATDKGYFFNSFVIKPIENDLYIRLTGFNGKRLYGIIKDYNTYTALEVITSVDFGRHFDNLIKRFYNDNGLPLGYVERILKDV